jgi:catalase-peroxidase
MRESGATSAGAWALVLILAGAASACGGGAATTPPTVPAGDAPGAPVGPPTIDDWWPNRLDLRALKPDAPTGDPSAPGFDYAAEFAKLDLAAVKADIAKVLTTSQAWWPADFGHYGGLMIRLAWHSAGTYRVTDGRGGAASGTIRFAPLNSWPDNVNLDKARRLLWPIKKKYGRALSWADLMVLSGNVALETMGFRTLGFGGGREDVFEPTDINWGPETEWLADQRFSKDGEELDRPLAAVQMGLIYVNPEGPGGEPDPLAAAKHIRIAFGRMAMNDEETVALIAGGHTLGKAHGAAKAKEHVGKEPEAAALEEQGLGWRNAYRSGKGADTITSGLEGSWTSTPARWSHEYFQNLFGHEWELTESPGGGKQWRPRDAKDVVPDAHIPGKRHPLMMFTTDLALREDPAYAKISRRFLEHPEEFEAAFARAWFKLTHRDMGPHVRLVGEEVPPPQIWQDPVPAAAGKPIDERDAAALKQQILAAGPTGPELVRAAWAAASTYRDTDKRGGANGARFRLAPQKDWAVNRPAELARVTAALEGVQAAWNAKSPRKVSLADLVVLGGNAAIEAAAKAGGHEIAIPFHPGRTDATAAQTDAASFADLEPVVDGFRNYARAGEPAALAAQLVDRADLLRLTAPEMAVLVAGLRVLDANADGSRHGVFTARPGTLSNDFFVTLIDEGLAWTRTKADGDAPAIYEGRDARGAVRWTATAVDLVFGSNSQLRAIAEVYAADDGGARFVQDFAAAWAKVMELDRFDLRARR